MPYAFADHQHEGCADETEILSELVARSMPPLGWVSQQMLGKNQSIEQCNTITALILKFTERVHLETGIKSSMDRNFLILEVSEFSIF